jgi:hypothetical protein
MLAFQIRGWELVVSNLAPDVLSRLGPQVTRSTEIAPGRFALELAAEPPPEMMVASVVTAGGTLVSLNPIRETLEEFFVRRVAEMSAGARWRD